MVTVTCLAAGVQVEELCNKAERHVLQAVVGRDAQLHRVHLRTHSVCIGHRSGYSVSVVAWAWPECCVQTPPVCVQSPKSVSQACKTLACALHVPQALAKAWPQRSLVMHAVQGSLTRPADMACNKKTVAQ